VCKALRLLAEGWEPEDAANQVGVRHKTMRAWLADSDFDAMLAGVKAFGRGQFASEVVNTLKGEAVDALRRLLQEGTGTATARVARDVLQWAQEVEDEQRKAADAMAQRKAQMALEPFIIAPWAERNPVVRKNNYWTEDGEEE
jgi:hypothetical protein